VIRTRDEALEFLAEASPGDLWRSAKISVDRRIKDLLSHAAFESLSEEVRSELHAGMLEIRSSFWAKDLENLSSAGDRLREIWTSGKIVSTAENREVAQQVQDRLLNLVEEVEMAVALHTCTRAEPDLGTAAYLECLLRGGPGD
jgi:nucleoside 2-deoxyribosyltransferase